MRTIWIFCCILLSSCSYERSCLYPEYIPLQEAPQSEGQCNHDQEYQKEQKRLSKILEQKTKEEELFLY